MYLRVLIIAIIVSFTWIDSLGVASVSSDSSSHLYNYDNIPGEPLSPSDFYNAEKLPAYFVISSLGDSSMNDAANNSYKGIFEGDIVISEGEEKSKDIYEKAAIIDSTNKWSNGIVPYLISSKFKENERSVIARAILEFHRRTCITFKPRRSEVDYIMIITGDGCSSNVGRQGGQQYVTLGNGCIYPGVVMHEFMHALGFWHEQSRWDRDDHVVIFFENIQPGMEDNFRKMSWQNIQNLSAPYDTSSIMHYGPYAFSKNRQKHYKTIAPRVANDNMGQRINFSETDVFKINRLYECSKTTEGDESVVEGSEANTQKCEDNHQNCSKWASSGECQKNPNWMLVNCKLSCNQCPTQCSNSNNHCDTWAAKGECAKNPSYMNTHCPKACNQCG